MKIAAIIGARPQFIKAAAISRAIAEHNRNNSSPLIHEEDIWSVRITLGVRSLGVLDGDTITWFWVGDHDDYKRFFG